MRDDTINDLPPGRPLPPSMDTPSDTARHVVVLEAERALLHPESKLGESLAAAIAALQAVERVRALVKKWMWEADAVATEGGHRFIVGATKACARELECELKEEA